MKKYVYNLRVLPGLYQSLVKGLFYQKQFIQKTIAIDIEEIKKEQDGSLNESDFKKITDYYGWAVPAILGEAFCLLRGKGMTERERCALTYLGALTGLFDDFFDEKNTPKNHIKELLENPQESLVRNSHEMLFVRFFRKALENSPNNDLLKSSFYEVFNAQVLSEKQNLPEIAREEIESITIRKGGVSLLFYRSVLGEDAREDEKILLYNLGSLFQLENDIFDVYKDYKSGIRTLATIETKINNLRETFTLMMDKTLISLGATDFALENKKKFWRFISLILLRGLVCLDFLEKSEKKTNGLFSPKDCSRRDLVCDMEKTSNKARLVTYFIKQQLILPV
jgi:hypothetical protein